jgi:hypothetical protein
MQRVKTPGGAPPATLLPSAKIGWQAVFGFLAAIGMVSAAESTSPMFKPAGIAPGGLNPHATITSIVKTQDAATITWSGFLKPFTVERTPSLTSPLWETILSTTETQGTVPTQGEMGFLRVTNSVRYIGSDVCSWCHDTTHAEWSQTRHAGAFETLRQIRQDKNPTCLPCHTVGYGIPTGFTSEATTSYLEGVQCENCHGPAGGHFDPDDQSIMPPVVTIAAETCGGCHTDVHHPTYDEWSESGHGHQSEDFEFAGSGASRMGTCGTCHSGGARLASVKAFEAGTTNVAFNGVDADNFPITCVVCHNPHEKAENEEVQPAQLRYPTSSTAFFNYNTSTSFAAQYNPQIQVCGQCHNERGAVWTGTGRPPHHSPQYNILIGQVADPSTPEGAEFNGQPSGHGNPASNPNQCVTCHTRPQEVPVPTEASPNYKGHRFEPQLQACAECHGWMDDPDFTPEELAEWAVHIIRTGTESAMVKTIAALDEWAATKIPGLTTPGHTNYVAFNGTNDPSTVVPWEFSTIGQLNSGRKSPGSAGQNRLPAEIKKARFLLYLVEHDGSKGVHNPAYVGWNEKVPGLLQQAEELAKNAPAVPDE